MVPPDEGLPDPSWFDRGNVVGVQDTDLGSIRRWYLVPIGNTRERNPVRWAGQEGVIFRTLLVVPIEHSSHTDEVLLGFVGFIIPNELDEMVLPLDARGVGLVGDLVDDVIQ